MHFVRTIKSRLNGKHPVALAGDDEVRSIQHTKANPYNLKRRLYGFALVLSYWYSAYRG